MSKEALPQTPIHTLSPEPPVERDARWHNVHRQLHHVWNVACGLSQGDRSDLEEITNHIVRLLRRSAPGPTIEVAYASCGNIERRSYTIAQAAARIAELEEHCERVGLEAAMAAQQLAESTQRAEAAQRQLDEWIKQARHVMVTVKKDHRAIASIESVLALAGLDMMLDALDAARAAQTEGGARA
jgi:hypothetical protein